MEAARSGRWFTGWGARSSASHHAFSAVILAAAGAWERLQVDVTNWADATLCVTPQDHDLLASLGGVNLYTLPLGVDTREVVYRPTTGAPLRALFLGSFQHPPNRSAARVLVDDIWPRLRAQLPGWELVLAGPGLALLWQDCRPRPPTSGA